MMVQTPSVSTTFSAGWGADERPFEAAEVLRELIAANLVVANDWDSLPAGIKEELRKSPDLNRLCGQLAENGLITEYQAGRVVAGTTFGLVMGNYRVVDRLASGGMGIIFKGEHVRLRRPVAIKVLPLSDAQDPLLLSRFRAEMEAVARLQHPNIVRAVDAGEINSPDPDAPVLHYHVMEYLPGQDLEDHVRDRGPFTTAAACQLGLQMASALAEAHRHGLVHRDIKPSNILLTPDGQSKLLDFGLALRPNHRMTEPGTRLGTMDFMAPEQAQDSSAVDIRADIYGLGATLFWCLTGEKPFPSRGNLVQDLAAHLSSQPPSPRDWRRELPVEWDRTVMRMMALDPNDRFATPQELIEALTHLAEPVAEDGAVDLVDQDDDAGGATPQEAATEQRRLLREIQTLKSQLALRDSDLARAREALLLALTRVTAKRHGETAEHLSRLARFCRSLAEEAAQEATYVGRITDDWIQVLENCVPLHDIGKIALPDHILLKPGRLDPEERLLMESHTVMGAELLEDVVDRYGNTFPFLATALAIARHHHERWDGTGYPDRLAGEFIPLEARLVTLADVYDALRSRRAYKPKLAHAATMEILRAGFGTQFDPDLGPAFERCAANWEKIYQQWGD